MKGIMVQGTASDVGKSVVATAFCRLFAEEGYRVAPFKAQNMALNSFVTVKGGEIGRSQAVQAEAAGVEPTVDMNPILLKPKGERIAEVIVHGYHYADLEAGEYQRRTISEMLGPVQESLDRLAEEMDVLVIEGAGSPAEINMKERDIVNMRTAMLADVPVLLIADIDRGGVFASIVGTLAILDPHERKRVKGIVINKFRGDLAILQPGLDWLEKETGIPVLGVLPWRKVEIDPEDSLALDRMVTSSPEKEIDIAVIRFPHISNFTDLGPLMRIPGVDLRWIEKEKDWGEPDVVVLPGTKNTMADLQWLMKQGLAERVQGFASSNRSVVGLCGGFQMMGHRLEDPEGVEDHIPSAKGLGLLPVHFHFEAKKRTVQTKGFVPSVWAQGVRVEGYEIHRGRAYLEEDAHPFLHLDEGGVDGAVAAEGRIWGTHLHGVFDQPAFLSRWINELREKKNLPPLNEEVFMSKSKEATYAELADWVRDHLDIEKVRAIMEGNR
ncbi:adenosylcobyric acid synthase (glutamine-hydrolysing) [Marininema mesophilum]|uniref:Cobyric acid synthase n=1 Tax=Marininema mesophilum TaxID=1048340 RepID=A0A1H2YHF0_9BACL|nr:cobyric acid synthase [Marininema mesophilum]SDX04596.1 adenosylcobyric acid synthase (glutamine-hydrolysing) [Marininema mesophilum]